MDTYFVANTKMVMHICSGCGIQWASTLAFYEARQKDHKTFYCPNGCSRYYNAENKEERLQRMLNEEQDCCIQAREEANVLERSCRAYKGHVTRLKRTEHYDKN